MSNEIQYIETGKLEFDPENPRFYRLNERAGSDDAVIEEMLDDESVQDLMLSIGEQDYFPGEPLLVVKKGKKFVVVEGNRRLAAVKLLNGDLKPPKKKEKGVQLILDEADYKPRNLPCLVYKNREDVLRYIGYRHITGVKEWDALSKAKYLKELSDTFYQGKDHDVLFKSLAKEIGSKPYYVGLLLT
ncbi:TPA: ParB N-terminal domain-containing protein, partial [Klebsiella pneumoniae]|nr:ParB N-terminal domain-containing protein [Klebsiella pneumoniae]